MTRRDDALDAALRLFAEQGYARTTVAQVEAAIGLSPGAGGLFRHVRSKQELLEGAVERAMTRRFSPPAGPYRSVGEALAQSVLALVDADPALWQLLIREGRALPLDMDALYARLVQPAFDQAVAFTRRWKGDTPDLEARVVFAIGGLLYLRVSQFSYGTVPAGIDEASLVAVAERLIEGT